MVAPQRDLMQTAHDLLETARACRPDLVQPVEKLIEAVRTLRVEKVLAPIIKPLEARMTKIFRKQGSLFLPEFAKLRSAFIEALDEAPGKICAVFCKLKGKHDKNSLVVLRLADFLELAETGPAVAP